MIKELILEYKKRKSLIRKRLKEFKDIYISGNDHDIFEELSFCIFTPQSKAVLCNKAVKNLKRQGLLFKGSLNKIRPHLKGVRFPNNKASYLMEARKLFISKNKLDIKSRIDPNDIIETREWFVKNVKGIGYKEASHFLRNIGFGKNISILDVHILNNLVKYKVIEERPSSITKKKYLFIEDKMKKFSASISIPLDELDLLFWSIQTGYVFK